MRLGCIVLQCCSKQHPCCLLSSMGGDGLSLGSDQGLIQLPVALLELGGG